MVDVLRKKKQTSKAKTKRKVLSKKSNKRLARANRNELGESGLIYRGAHVYEERTRDLRVYNQRYLTYEDMRKNSPLIGAVMFVITSLIKSIDFEILPKDAGNQQDADAAEFIKTVTEDMPSLKNIMDDMLSFIPHGFSIFEIVLKKRSGKKFDKTKSSKFTDGKIGVGKLGFRSQSSFDGWEFNAQGEAVAVRQRLISREVVKIPLSKVVHFKTTPGSANPEGYSLFRNIYRPWYFLSRLEELEAIGAERDLNGYPVLRLPGEIIEEAGATYAAWQDAIRDIRRDAKEGVILAADKDDNGNYLYDIQLLRVDGDRQVNLHEVITRYSKTILMRFLADWIMLGQDQSGSFALSSDKTKMFALALSGLTQIIADTLTDQLFQPLININNMQGQVVMRFEDFEKMDLKTFGDLLTTAAGVGMDFTDEETQREIRSLLNLPMDVDFEEPVEEVNEPPPQVEQESGLDDLQSGE